MSSTFSTVSSMVKRGAISTSPPMLDTAIMASAKPIAVRSSFLCISGMSLLPRHERLVCAERFHTLAQGPRLMPDRHQDVVGADHCAGKEEEPADGARNVVGVHRDERLDEGIGQRA